MAISAEKLNKLRIHNGWSQERMAEISGLSLRTIQRLERGEASSLESQLAIAKAFDIAPSELLENEEVAVGKGGTNWSGVGGILLIIFLMISEFEMGGGSFSFLDLPSVFLAIGIPIGMASISLGANDTFKMLKLMRFLIVLPKLQLGLQHHLPVLNWFIFYCYAAGVISTLVGIIAVLFYPVDFSYSGELANRNPTLFGFGTSLLTLLYGAMLAEFVIRPLKHKIERLLIQYVK